MSWKVYSLHLLQNRWYNYYHANKWVDVEHGNKSLDYRPLTNVINQCEAFSPLMSMSAKVPKYILQSANKWVDVEPLARSNDQGTLMYSHDCQRENLPLRHASLKVLTMNSFRGRWGKTCWKVGLNKSHISQYELYIMSGRTIDERYEGKIVFMARITKKCRVSAQIWGTF